MSECFGDRIAGAIRERNAPACVGFDPLIERFPVDLLADHGITVESAGAAPGGIDDKTAASAIQAFGEEVIRAVAETVPVVKINIAFFEPYHSEGIRAYGRLVRYARDQGLIVIGDVKRADIGHTTAQYARAQLAPIDDPEAADFDTPDSVTVNPYFGYDGIGPFVDIARETGRGLFVLVQTSNQSAVEVQGLSLSDGSTVCDGVAKLVQSWASREGLVGASGYSCIGAVVSPRDLASTRRIRAEMPNTMFLVPGFGAQGRTAREVAECFKSDGSGAFVNASRSVIYAHADPQCRDKFGKDWRACINGACADFVKAIRAAIGSQPV